MVKRCWLPSLLIIVSLIFSTSGVAGPLRCGIVEGMPLWHQHHVSFHFQTTQHHYYLTWYGDHPALKPGQHWCLPLTIKTFASWHSRQFPGWLYWHNYTASGYVNNRAVPKLTKIDPWWYQPFATLRLHWQHRLWDTLWHNPNRDVLQALALGDRAAFQPGRWQTFIHTGTSHLMAISGLHLGMVVAVVFAIVLWLIKRVPRWCAIFSAQQSAMLVAMLFAVFYGVLTGLAVPTERALVMITVVGFGILLRRNVSNLWGWCLAAVIILLIHPRTIGQAGAWLSFVAVALLLWGYHYWQPKRWWGHMLYTQWLLFIGLLPIELFFFGQVSWASWPANIVAIPVVSMVVLPLVLVAMVLMWFWQPVAAWLLHIAGLIFGWLYDYLQWLANQNWWGIAIQPVGIYVALGLCVVVITLLLLSVAVIKRFFNTID